jgi:hypothetical protein
LQQRKRYKILLLCGVFLLFSCGQSRVGGSREAVAMRFLTQVYALQFDKLSDIVADQALYQVAVLEGRTEVMNETQRVAYIAQDIEITQLQSLNNDTKVIITYQVRFQDGRTMDNRLELVQTTRHRWQVVRVYYPLISGNLYDY